MAVPKRKKSRANTRMRRSAWLKGEKVKKVTITTCSQCGEATLPHHVCNTCGYYGGRLVLDAHA